mmetsp:Transcript_45753/g.67541  ORF Transcript_45753/g.67541 Transcript_45753/m.67541 type:complete len:380 (-) Transcript_45753:136-1275(-)|eukprot:CAMPEP_0195529852 /NCGR_PEP_ID=MMETSP0794_2-20130614/32502_1 /TAXON_ID=515487 /ORGANISM="Stephanopyxis turris, Strain CCMP 815" /LENGTH=379 /DNA_ID=CAMNT_0040661225 /DNA_START=67 /DNA_END=1206 /DNA_ORIENTATION=+
MDAIVQLIRNAMCCVKDLELFADTPLHDPNFTSKFYVFPSPYMSKTTPLELLISISQLYACVSCSISGFKLISSSILKSQRLVRVTDLLKKNKRPEKKKDDDKDANVAATVNELVAASVANEAISAQKNTLVGICVLPIGLAFFWLFANSLHITEAGWIGGLPALIHALVIMEIALVPLLYFMLKDAAEALRKSADIRALAENFDGKKRKDVKETWINLDTYSLIVQSGWTPFWTESANSSMDIDAEDKMLSKELEAVEKNIKFDPNAVIITVDKGNELEQIAKVSMLEGYREYAYFIFNFIAFYGYLLGIVVYYFDDEEKQSAGVRSLKMGYSNDDADWGGNFAGDFMWTVEPIVILLSPFLIRQMTKTKDPEKVKSD